MTTSTTSTTSTITAKDLNLDAGNVTAIKTWLNKTRVDQCHKSLQKWLDIGDICSRIKAGKFEGKFKDNVNTFIGVDLTNDERQYSMKCFDIKPELVAWYNESNCLKYNPRTIFTAYQNKDKAPLTKEEKDAKAAEKVAQDAKKERSSVEVLQAYTAYLKIRENAAENGNLELKDLELLETAITKELSVISDAVKIERKANAVEEHKAA